jgi:HTH-type transcriptional regulator / antitoxin HigA
MIMTALRYKVIKSKRQYREYANILEELVSAELKSKDMKDEIELLTLLIEKWDDDHNTFDDVDPITLLRGLMEERNLKAKDLVGVLG